MKYKLNYRFFSRKFDEVNVHFEVDRSTQDIEIIDIEDYRGHAADLDMFEYAQMLLEVSDRVDEFFEADNFESVCEAV
jgi:hypothetical protein